MSFVEQARQCHMETLYQKEQKMIYKGIGVAICTPFDSKGEFNSKAYKHHINFLIENGVKAIISCGTTGEASTMSLDEQLSVVECAVKSADGRVPIIAGAGGNNTAACIKSGKEFTNIGANALMYVAPYYNKTSQKGLIQHFTHIADNVNLPIMIYNVPSRTGLNISPNTIAEIAKHERIVAIKEASSDITQITEVFALSDIHVYSGNDDHILPVMALGGLGVVSTIGNIVPKKLVSLINACISGDYEQARLLQFEILPLWRLLFADVNPMPVKAALNILGFDAGACRLPLTDIDDSLKEQIKAIL